MSAALFQAALGNRIVPDGAMGWEPIARATRLILARDLNDEIDSHSEKWSAADLQLQQMGFDPGVGQVDVDHVPDDHLHEGPHESFLSAPIEMFPNISVMAYLNRPSARQGYASMPTNDITLEVVTICAAGPIPDGLETAFETIVHRKIQRTSEAVIAVIQNDKTLLGTVLPQELPPSGGIGKQSWIRPRNGETGPMDIFHGSRLQYTLQRLTTS